MGAPGIERPCNSCISSYRGQHRGAQSARVNCDPCLQTRFRGGLNRSGVVVEARAARRDHPPLAIPRSRWFCSREIPAHRAGEFPLHLGDDFADVGADEDSWGLWHLP